MYPIELTHVGRFTQIWDDLPAWVNPAKAHITELTAYLSPSHYFKSFPGWCRPDRAFGTRQLCAVRAPDMGDVGFYKEWTQTYSDGMTASNGAASLCARFEVPDFRIEDLDTYISRLKSVLRVLSLLGRQQIQLWGLSIRQGTVETTIVIDPLDPYKPPYAHDEPRNALVAPHKFAQLGTRALASYSLLSADKKTGLDHLIVSVTPFLNLQTSQRFANMMHALDTHDLWELPAAHRLTDSDHILLGKLNAGRSQV